MEIQDFELDRRSLDLYGLKKLVAPKHLLQYLSLELPGLEGVRFVKDYQGGAYARVAFKSVAAANAALSHEHVALPIELVVNFCSATLRPLPPFDEPKNSSQNQVLPQLSASAQCSASTSSSSPSTSSTLASSLLSLSKDINVTTTTSSSSSTLYSLDYGDTAPSSGTSISVVSVCQSRAESTLENAMASFSSSTTPAAPTHSNTTSTCSNPHETKALKHCLNLKAILHMPTSHPAHCTTLDARFPYSATPPAWKALLDQLEEEEKAAIDIGLVRMPVADMEGYEDEDSEENTESALWGYSLEDLGLDADVEDEVTDKTDAECQGDSKESQPIYRFDDRHSLDGTYITDDYDGENDFFHPYSSPTTPPTNCITHASDHPIPPCITLIDLKALAKKPSPVTNLRSSKRDCSEDLDRPSKKARRDERY